MTGSPSPKVGHRKQAAESSESVTGSAQPEVSSFVHERAEREAEGAVGSAAEPPVDASVTELLERDDAVLLDIQSAEHGLKGQ